MPDETTETGNRNPVRTQIEARRVAKVRAGLILESALANGWGLDPEHEEQFGGKEGADLVRAAMTELAEKLGQGVRVG